MRVAVGLLTAGLVAVASSIASAGEVKSGIPVGGVIGAYSTTKCAGIEDGVKPGASLCYT